MKRKRFTALKVTLTAMMLTAALTSGVGSAYAADLSQEGGSEPTVTITPSPEVTPELPSSPGPLSGHIYQTHSKHLLLYNIHHEQQLHWI